MAILKIARMGHPVLHRIADAVDDLAAPEVKAIVRDMIETLDDAGMDVSDVVKTNLYMTNPADIGAIMVAHGKYFGDHIAAGTLVFVSALALPEVSLELEAVAAKQE